jgi:hypothetical protein
MFNLLAPSGIGSVSGADGNSYPVVNGVVTVPQSCVDPLLATGFVMQGDNQGANVGIGTLVAGAATIPCTAVQGVNDRIVLTVRDVSGVGSPQALSAPSAQLLPGVSFGVVSANAADTSTFIWQIV